MEDYKQLIKNRKPDVRYLNDMKQVIYDKEWIKNAPNSELYYMYRKVKEENGLALPNFLSAEKLGGLARQTFPKENLGGLVNHITVIPPKMLGEEYVKTKGHYHTKKEYGEIYVVLEGKGLFLSQKEKNGIIEDVFYVKAKKGEYVVIPSGYGHVMINDSLKDLVTIDWSSEKCKGDYSLIMKRGGACYFYTKSGWIKNNNYKKVPELRFEKPKKTMPKNLDFLYGK